MHPSGPVCDSVPPRPGVARWRSCDQLTEGIVRSRRLTPPSRRPRAGPRRRLACTSPSRAARRCQSAAARSRQRQLFLGGTASSGAGLVLIGARLCFQSGQIAFESTRQPPDGAGASECGGSAVLESWDSPGNGGALGRPASAARRQTAELRLLTQVPRHRGSYAVSRRMATSTRRTNLFPGRDPAVRRSTADALAATHSGFLDRRRPACSKCWCAADVRRTRRRS